MENTKNIVDSCIVQRQTIDSLKEVTERDKFIKEIICKNEKVSYLWCQDVHVHFKNEFRHPI